MELRSGGIDIFYIDESHDRHVYVVSSVCIPLLRPVGTKWHVVWHESFQAARDWRKAAKVHVGIPPKKELHGVKLASGRGKFNQGLYNFPKPKACAIYRELLSNIEFLPPYSVMSASATRGRFLYGNFRLEAALYALFQRMRRKCIANDTNAIVFFDRGHPEYRTLYRKAQVYLPTGSRLGSWGDAATKNLPLDMFIEDGNEKDSKHCFFTQIADLIAYSAFLKMKGEQNTLQEWQARLSANNIYDSLPDHVLNTKASTSQPKDGIVRL